jgi:hypothetical protein
MNYSSNIYCTSNLVNMNIQTYNLIFNPYIFYLCIIILMYYSYNGDLFSTLFIRDTSILYKDSSSLGIVSNIIVKYLFHVFKK